MFILPGSRLILLALPNFSIYLFFTADLVSGARVFYFILLYGLSCECRLNFLFILPGSRLLFLALPKFLNFQGSPPDQYTGPGCTPVLAWSSVINLRFDR